MAAVPLPDVPCVRVRLIYNTQASKAAGNRFYVSYAGAAPSAATLNTLATSIEGLWGSAIAPLIATEYSLNEVDVLDIATDAGASGSWTGEEAGTRSGTGLPDQCAVNIEFDIARRYRGGKPRIFFPPPVDTDLFSPAEYNAAFVTAATTGVEAFFSGIEALTPGTMTSLTHVNLSYYKGFTNYTPPSGRARAVPTYRPEALHDDITGYSVKEIIGSQRRRRTSTTP